MKRLARIVAGIVFASHASFAAAQTPAPAEPPQIDDLKAPSTPAATLLGTTPSSIERPDNPKALIVNLVSNVAASDGVPTNYAVALTPYWMRWHPTLTFDSYAKPTLGQRIARTFSVSLATADWTTGDGAAKQDLGSRVALGLSTVVLQGDIDEEVFTVRKDLEKNLENLLRELLNRQKGEPIVGLKARKKALAAKLAAATTPDEAIVAQRELTEADNALRALIAAEDRTIQTLHAERRELAKRIETLTLDRKGVRLGVAAAWTWSLPDDAFGEAALDRQAIWVTPSYRWARPKKAEEESDDDSADDGQVVTEEDDLGVEQPPPEIPEPASGIEEGGIELVGALRYLRQKEAADSSAGWDVGARLVWQIRNELALSGEIVKREWDSGTIPDSYRASAVFEARLGASAYIFASFGRDYAEKGTRSTLVSLVGLNIGVGKKPLLTN